EAGSFVYGTRRRQERIMSAVETIFELFNRAGSGAYFGEAVTQLAHALQSAHLAETDGADDALVAAALLHDIGHLLSGLPAAIREQAGDDRHEAGGATWLARHFGPAVSEPVRLHVASKRYLCAVDPNYTATLSDASRLSLQLQGGAFTPEQAKAFARHPHADDAVRLRRWDDRAK